MDEYVVTLMALPAFRGHADIRDSMKNTFVSFKRNKDFLVLTKFFSTPWVPPSPTSDFILREQYLFLRVKNISDKRVLTYLALLASEVRSQAHVMKLELNMRL